MKDSPPVQLCEHVWRHAEETGSHSCERLNHAMYSALMLAVGSGMRFNEGDFAEIISRFNGGRWICDSSRFYGEAVVCGNVSAAKSYEAWTKQPPYIADDLEWSHWHTGFVHRSHRRKRSRLFAGATFRYRGERVTVTTIGPEALTACTYKPRAEGRYEHKVLKRFRITLADLKADRLDGKAHERRE